MAYDINMVKLAIAKLSKHTGDKQVDKQVLTTMFGGNNIPDGLVDFIATCIAVGQNGKFKVPRNAVGKGDMLFCQDLRCMVATTAQDEETFGYYMATCCREDKDIQQYIDEKLYEADIDLVNKMVLMSESTGDVNEQVVKDIKTPETFAFSKVYVAKTQQIEKYLKMAYEAVFSLSPYIGVFIFDDGYNSVSICPRGNTMYARYKSAPPKNQNAYLHLAKVLSSKEGSPFKMENISFSTSVDLEAMQEGPKYYPWLSFCIASKARPELDGGEVSRGQICFKLTGVYTWSDYWKKVHDVFEDMVAMTIYKAAEKASDVKFTSIDFRSKYNKAEADHATAAAYNDIVSKASALVETATANLVKSLCTLCVLSKADGLCYGIRLGYFKQTVGDAPIFSSPKELFNDPLFTGGKLNMQWADPIDLVTYERDVSGEPMKDLYFLQEYKFAEDLALMNAMPLWGYQVARAMREQGQHLDSNHMMLGEGTDGMPVFSDKYDSNIMSDLLKKDGKIHTQGALVHRISAGSRSGKGVMTMTLLASGLASGGMLFYIDRKPDMASTFSALSGGNMFIVNGASLDAENDTSGHFINYINPLMVKYKALVSSGQYTPPEYMKRVFGDSFGSNWDKDGFGDFIYLKALIFAIGIIRCRIDSFLVADLTIKARYTSMLRTDIKMMLVLDEITNWHNNFESHYFSDKPVDISKSNYFLYALEKTGEGGKADNADPEVELLRQNVALAEESQMLAEAKAREAKESGDTDAIAKTYKALMSANTSLSKARTALEKKEGKPDEGLIATKLYWRTLFLKYASIIQGFENISNAGFNPDMIYDNDIYAIGQGISGRPVPDASKPTYAPYGRFNKEGDSINQPYYNQGLTPPPASSSGGTDKDGKKKKESVSSGDSVRSYLVSALDQFPHDWFVGKNFERYDFGRKANKEFFSWCYEMGNWAYFPSVAQEDARYGFPGNPILLKPYSVLNTSDECPNPASSTLGPYDPNPKAPKEEKVGVYKYLVGSAKRLNSVNLWLEARRSILEDGCEDYPAWGHIHKGVGLAGLIEEYMRTKEGMENWTLDPSIFATSKQVADNVAGMFGYACYEDYLLDLSPSAIIGYDDITLMLQHPDTSFDDPAILKLRFPKYYDAGRMDLLGAVGAASQAALEEEQLPQDILDQIREMAAQGYVFKGRPIDFDDHDMIMDMVSAFDNGLIDEYFTLPSGRDFGTGSSSSTGYSGDTGVQSNSGVVQPNQSGASQSDMSNVQPNLGNTQSTTQQAPTSDFMPKPDLTGGTPDYNDDIQKQFNATMYKLSNKSRTVLAKCFLVQTATQMGVTLTDEQLDELLPVMIAQIMKEGY